MEILAHSLWSAAIAKGINNRKAVKGDDSKKVNPLWTAFWGIFPDIFSFSVFFIWVIGSLVFGGESLRDINRPRVELYNPDAAPIYILTRALYSVSHSIIVFGGVLVLLLLIKFLFFRKNGKILTRIAFWEMSGWLLHIFLDIPSHSHSFYPTPIFWPVSPIEVSGISWTNPWFMLFNYFAIIVVYFVLLRKKPVPKTGKEMLIFFKS